MPRAAGARARIAMDRPAMIRFILTGYIMLARSQIERATRSRRSFDLPVLHGQPVNSTKFAPIVGHQDQVPR
jgi:hypothetical protein